MTSEMVQVAKPKYYGTKVLTGLYIQPHDDGETFSVIANILTPQDPKDKMLWWHGVIPRNELQYIAGGSVLISEGDIRYALEEFAQHGGYETKREAVAAAITNGDS